MGGGVHVEVRLLLHLREAGRHVVVHLRGRRLADQIRLVECRCMACGSDKACGRRVGAWPAERGSAGCICICQIPSEVFSLLQHSELQQAY